MTEYVIWGKPPGDTDEQLLVVNPGGKPVTKKSRAEELLVNLVKVHGCSDCRIQVLDGSLPDFVNVLSKK